MRTSVKQGLGSGSIHLCLPPSPLYIHPLMLNQSSLNASLSFSILESKMASASSSCPQLHQCHQATIVKHTAYHTLTLQFNVHSWVHQKQGFLFVMHKLNQADEKDNHTQITKCFFLHSTPVQASSALKSSMRTVMVIHKVKGKVKFKL